MNDLKKELIIEKQLIILDNVLVYDLETIKGCFLASFYSPLTGEFYDFICNSKRNDISTLLKFLEDNQDKYFIGYNNINFDSQIIEKMMDCQDFLIGMRGEEVSKFLWQFAQDLIETTKFGGFLPYKEYQLRYKQIDPFKILHGENKNRIANMSLVLASLKLG